MSAGLDPTRISIRVLGYAFSGLRPRKADPHEDQRLTDATRRPSRCACLPGSIKRKIRVAQLAVLPRASWGWLFQRAANTDITAIEGVFRRLLKMQRVASPCLYKIFRGHL